MTTELFEHENEEFSDESGYAFTEYDITSSPNDFNVKTIFDFIEKGIFKIPAFQRNYVWDLGRASRLIESIIMGLPIPQIFLFETEKNQFLVIDGQQRLMSIYYFMKMKFPNTNKRNEIRTIFDRESKIPDNIFSDDNYFSKFNLKLAPRIPTESNVLSGLNYDTLDEYKISFELKTIRCVMVKQNIPTEDESSIFEIFNRLNTGGLNLTAQEIRMSLYHSDFMRLISKTNTDSRWRHLINSQEPDIRMRDLEVLLRGFAMLVNGNNYRPSMTSFLNIFAKQATKFNPEEITLLQKIISSFLDKCSHLPPGVFGTRSKSLNISVFESIFRAASICGYNDKTGNIADIPKEKIDQLKQNTDFMDAASTKSTNKSKVDTRLRIANEIFGV